MCADRPIGNFEAGLATCTLRVREGPDQDYTAYLRTAFVTLFQIYGDGFFDVSVTCNVILQGISNGKFSVFYGQDFGDRQYNIGPPTVVQDLGDVVNVPTDLTVDDFAEVFHAIHDDTDVTVHSIICIVFIMTRFLENFERDKVAGQRQVILY